MSVIYRKYKQYKQLIVPIIRIGLRHGNSWYPVEVYVDSGATYSVFHERVAERMGLNIRKGKRIYVEVGDGGLINVFLHEMDIQLGNDVFTATIGFSDRLGIGFNLLGRKSIFERY